MNKNNENLNINIEQLVNEYITMKNKLEKMKKKHRENCYKYVSTHKEKVAEKRKENYYKKYANDPEWMKKKTEKNRMYLLAKREREGIELKKRGPKPKTKNIDVVQPILIAL